MSRRVLILPICPICQDESSKDSYLFTLCGHTFHSSCIRRWDQTQLQAKKQTKCPSCNSILKRISTTINHSKSTQLNLGSRFVSIHSLSEEFIEKNSTNDSTQSESILNNREEDDDDDDDGQFKKLEKGIIECKKKIKEQEDRIERLKKEPEALLQQNLKLQTESNRLKDELNSIKTRERNSFKKLSNQIEFEKTLRKEDVKGLRNELIELQTQLNETKSLCIRFKSERDEVQSKFNKQTRELEDTIENMISFSEENKKLRSDHSSLSTELQMIRATVRSLKQRSATFESKYEKYKTEVITLRKQVNPILSSQKHSILLDNEASTSTSPVHPELSTLADPSSSSSSSRLNNTNHPTFDSSHQISPSSSKLPTTTSSAEDFDPILLRKKPHPSSTSLILKPKITPTSHLSRRTLRSPHSNRSLQFNSSFSIFTSNPFEPKSTSRLESDESDLTQRSLNQSNPTRTFPIFNSSHKRTRTEFENHSSSIDETMKTKRGSNERSLGAEVNLHLPSLFGPVQMNSNAMKSMKNVLRKSSSEGLRMDGVLNLNQGILKCGPKIKKR